MRLTHSVRLCQIIAPLGTIITRSSAKRILIYSCFLQHINRSKILLTLATVSKAFSQTKDLYLLAYCLFCFFNSNRRVNTVVASDFFHRFL